MLNHVARSAILHHPPFQTIFQEAAARAYSRVQTGRSPINVLRPGPSTEVSSRDIHVPIISIPCAVLRMIDFSRFSHSTFSIRKPSCWRFCSNLTVQRGLLRHYSSRAPPQSAPTLPVFSAIPSLRPKGKSKKRSFISQKGQQFQSPLLVLRDTAGGPSLSNSEIDFLDQALSPSTALEDNPMPTPLDLRNTSQPSVTISSTHCRNDSLSRQLHHLYLSSPHASIQSLVSYHDSFPDRQSTWSYNLLIRLSIRHSAFGTAHTLLRSMRASRVPEDLTTWKLCVRLLVREGRWLDAYNLVMDLPKNPSCAPFASDGAPVHVWAELLGTVKRGAFGDMTQMRDPGMYNLARYHHVMRQLPKLGISSKDTPPPQVVYASVAALLRMRQREAAQQVTTQFLAIDPKGLGLRLVHLHVAAEPRRHSLATFYRALRDLQGFRVVCPKLKPNSTTLFLLLGHLKGVKRCGIIGHKFVEWFRRRWGNSVVSPRVEQRLLALAVKEKRVDLIKQWMTCVKTRRKIWWMWSLEREVVDGGIPKRRSLSRDPDLRLARVGTERLNVDRILRRASRVLLKSR